MRAGALLLLVLPSTLVAVFQCPSDGHHVDPESCASFYMCANGRVTNPFTDQDDVKSPLPGLQYDLLPGPPLERDQE